MRLTRKSRSLAADNMSIKSSVSLFDRMSFRRNKRESFFAPSAIELSNPQPAFFGRDSTLSIVPVTNLEKLQVSTSSAPKAAEKERFAYSLRLSLTSTEFFPSTIDNITPPTPPSPNPQGAAPTVEIPEIALEEPKPEMVEVKHGSYFQMTSGFSPFPPSSPTAAFERRSLIPAPLNVPRYHERPASLISEASDTSIQPSIFHVRTPTADSIPDSMTTGSSAPESARSTPPPSTPTSERPPSPAIYSTPPSSVPQTPTSEAFPRVPKSPESIYASPAIPRQSRRSTATIAPDPDSPLVLTLTSKYPTGAAAALYVPENVSLPRGMKPTGATAGRILKAKMAFGNLKTAAEPKPPTTQLKLVPQKAPQMKPVKPSAPPVSMKKPVKAATMPAMPTTARRPSSASGIGSALGKVASFGAEAVKVKDVWGKGTVLSKRQDPVQGSLLRKKPKSLQSSFYY